MPSPTSSTRPTSRVSSCVRYCSISFCSTETISSALNLMTAHLPQLFTQIDQLRAHGPVQHPVGHANDDAAQKLRINSLVQHRFEVVGFAKVVQEAPLLVARQRHHAAHLHAE